VFRNGLQVLASPQPRPNTTHQACDQNGQMIPSSNNRLIPSSNNRWPSEPGFAPFLLSVADQRIPSSTAATT
jgi:hypothetical protein